MNTTQVDSTQACSSLSEALERQVSYFNDKLALDNLSQIDADSIDIIDTLMTGCTIDEKYKTEFRILAWRAKLEG